MMKAMAKGIAAILVALLCACGGGADEDDQRATPGPVDCKAKPKECI